MKISKILIASFLMLSCNVGNVYSTSSSYLNSVHYHQYAGSEEQASFKAENKNLYVLLNSIENTCETKFNEYDMSQIIHDKINNMINNLNQVDSFLEKGNTQMVNKILDEVTMNAFYIDVMVDMLNDSSLMKQVTNIYTHIDKIKSILDCFLKTDNKD